MRFSTVPEVYTEGAAIAWLNRQRQHAACGTGIVLAIAVTAEIYPIGMVGLFGLDRADHSERLGYWLIGRARGRGIATTTARAMIEWAFERLSLDQVIIEREPGNLASAKVATKLGALETDVRLVNYRGCEVELIRYVVSQPSG